MELPSNKNHDISSKTARLLILFIQLNMVYLANSCVIKLPEVGQKNIRNNGVVIHSSAGIGFIMCARQCEKIGHCVGFNFNPTLLQCELLKTKRAGTNSVNGCWWFADNVAWLKEKKLSTGTTEKSCGSETWKMKIKLNDKSVHCIRPKMPIDCNDSLITSFNTENGAFQISPKKNIIFDVKCDIKSAEGGWTVLQTRISGDVNFHETWSMYKDGFGDLLGNFWLGNNNIHALLSTYSYKLRVDLEDFENRKVYAIYTTFQVDGIEEKYKLTIGGYSGDAGDSFSAHNGMKFSTHDSDNDLSTQNCASRHKGGWWFTKCYNCNLNGGYFPQSNHILLEDAVGIHWFRFRTGYYSLKRASMKVIRNT